MPDGPRRRQPILNERLTSNLATARGRHRVHGIIASDSTSALKQSEKNLAYLAQQPAKSTRRRARRGPGGHNPLLAPLLLFVAVALVAASYVAYVLWPRWPEAPVARDAPSMPIVVAGVTFNIEPAAIRQAIQRDPGVQPRVDLVYLWPSLQPPDPTQKPTVHTRINPDERLFITIESGDGTLPLIQRVENIYPRYLEPQPTAGPPGLTLRGFRDGTPYQDEDLIFESAAPTHFLARCTRRGVVNAGNCLLERRIGLADVTFRFPRAWLKDWQSVAKGIDTLMARLHGG